MQRSLLIFENSIKSKYSLKTYKYHLEKFLGFSKIKDFDSLLRLDDEAIQVLLENYVMHLKNKGLTASSIKSYLCSPELFFDVNKRTFHRKILHRMIPEPDKEGNDLPYTTEDIQKMLKATTSKRLKALIHFLASTGSRPNVIVDPVLQFKHLYPMSFGCRAILLYAGSKYEQWSFLTPEANAVFQEYMEERMLEGEKITPESPIFATQKKFKDQKVKPLSNEASHIAIYYIVQKARIERIKTGNRYDKGMNVGFRKRFNTILKLENSLNASIAEKLMGHKGVFALDKHYLKPTRDQCFHEFVKAIRELTIDPTERQKVKIKQLEEEKSKLDSMNTEALVNLSDRVIELERRLAKNKD